MKKRFVHIGCGKRNWGGWYNVDKANFKHIDSEDIYLFNLPINSVDVIYASHFLEYFSLQDTMNLLFSWKLALKKGGKIYLSVPNFRKMSELYLNDKIPLHKFIGPLFGEMKCDNETIYHKTVYDYASLGELLRFCGFKRIEPWTHDEFKWGKNDDHSHAKINYKLISLNICCEK